MLKGESEEYTYSQELLTERKEVILCFMKTNRWECRVLTSPLDVQLDCDDRTIVQPDIALVCRNERITRKGI